MKPAREKRKHPRLAFSADVTLFADDGSATSWPTLNLSRGGLAAYCEVADFPFTVSAEETRIQFDDADSMEVDATVVWVEPEFVGFAFVKPLSDATLKKLQKACDGRSQTMAMMPDAAQKIEARRQRSTGVK